MISNDLVGRSVARPLQRASALPITLLVVILAAFAAFHALAFRPALTGPDAHGYFLQVRLLVHTGSTVFTPESPVQYVGPHWLDVGSGRVGPVYGSGFAVTLLPGYLAAGPTGALVTNLVLALLSLAAMFLLVLRLAGVWSAVAATALLAFLPAFNEQVHWGGAHVAVACLFLWGFLLLVRLSESRGAWPAIAAGLLFGAIPAVRYPEAVLGVGFLLWLLYPKQRERRVGTALLGMVGAAVPAVLLLLYSRLTYGAWFATGYAGTGEQAAFALSYVGRNTLPYLGKLFTEGAGPVALLGVPGLVALWLVPDRRRLALLLSLSALLPLLVYLAYYWPPDPMSMRFLLPTLPVYVIAAVLLVRRVTQRNPQVGAIVQVALVLVTAFWGVRGALVRVQMISRQGDGVLVVTRMIDRHVPVGAVLAGSGEEFSHFDFLGKWRLADITITAPTGGQEPGPGEPSSRQVRARVRNPRAVSRYSDSGPWLLRRFAQDCEDWARDSAGVWWLVPGEQLESMRSALAGLGNLVEVDAVALPTRRMQLPGETQRSARPGGVPSGRLVLYRWYRSLPPEVDRSARNRN